MADMSEGLIMRVERRRPWRSSATVWLLEPEGPSRPDPRCLLTVSALTRRRAARFIVSLRELLKRG
jgi:hypothetical protein